jgi:hypothetical protein
MALRINLWVLPIASTDVPFGMGTETVSGASSLLHAANSILAARQLNIEICFLFMVLPHLKRVAQQIKFILKSDSSPYLG